VLAAVMLDGGLVAHFQQRRAGSPNPEQRHDAERVLEDLRSLCRAAQAYGEQKPEHASLSGFLEHAAGLHARELAPGEPDRRITVSTVYRAKGTEAELVVLLACRSGCCPPGARSPPPTPSSSPRSAGCSTSPSPTRRTGC
jgi:DNA helicase II / ATP-dependent DNA helicase PcrA